MSAEKKIFDERQDAGYKRCPRGFSLVEVLVAMTILSIGILGITSLAGTSVNTGAFAQNMTQATNIAQDRIEALQSIPYRNLQTTDTATARTDLRRSCVGPAGPVSRPVYACTPTNVIVMGAKSFTWTYTVTFIDLNNDGTANEMSDGIKRLDVAVTWGDMLSRTNKTTTITTVVGK